MAPNSPSVVEVSAPEEVVTSQRSNVPLPDPNRAQRRAALRHMQRTEKKKPQRETFRMKPLPPVATALRVLVQPDEFFTLEVELELLAALAELRRQQPQVKLSYQSQTPALQPYLKQAWFLDRLSPSQEATAFRLEVSEPDPLAATQEEERQARLAYTRQVEYYQYQLRLIEQLGLQDMRPEPPGDYHFMPRWHRTQGFLWQLADQLGLEVEIPGQPLTPFLPLSQNNSRSLQAKLGQEKLTQQKFWVYNLEPATEAEMLQQLQLFFPQARLISQAEVEALHPEDSLTALLGLLRHPNCVGTLGPVGSLTGAAWAAGVPYQVLLYQGSNYGWDGVQSPGVLSLDRGRFTDEQLPLVLREALVQLFETDLPA